ncbi:MAG: hypothetical protein JRF72_12840 [Deltaproteobacteria bacterium]|nr:hypothetical protein [Deltaproteobacteria bacterium]
MKSDTRKTNEPSRRPDIWIISDASSGSADLNRLEIVPDEGTLREYQISDIARYLLSPNSIEIKKRLIGCEAHLRKRRLTRMKEAVSRIFPRRIRRWINADPVPPEVLLSSCKLKIPYLKDCNLRDHFSAIYELLRSYDVVIKKLPRLNPRKIDHLIGICEDIGGHLSYLKLQGGIEEKIKYVTTYISKDVGVVLKKAYQADGLFELRGFDFGTYQHERSHRLLSFLSQGKPCMCVLDRDDNIGFWIDDEQLLKYIQLLEHSIKANPNLRNAFYQCSIERAKAVKLFFNKKLDIDYSKTHFPKVYREVFNTHNVGFSQRNLVKPSLNYLLIGVSLNYVPLTDAGEDQLVTHISVLHDLRALESLKSNLPQVYSEISKSAFNSEAGRYYLLDSIEGHSNA